MFLDQKKSDKITFIEIYDTDLIMMIIFNPPV
jgi:hypothetical protein